MSQAQAADVVTTYQDENGWKLLVNGNDFYVKGVVWGYTPRNQNFNYDLYGQPPEQVSVFYESLPDPDAEPETTEIDDFLDGLSGIGE